MIACFNIIKAILVRLFLCIHVILCVWRVVISLENPVYWLLLAILLPFVAEAVYTIIKRHGDDFLRFSPCIFFYLGALLPAIWLLELDKSDRYIAGQEADLEVPDNSTLHDNLPIPSLNPAMWIIVLEEMMPYVVVLSRWALPRGRVTREQLAEILFAFIGIAADIMEFFSLFGEEVVRKNKSLGYAVLSIWSFSVLQFTMTITIVNEPKRARKVKVIVAENLSEEEEKSKTRHEVFAIFLIMFMQDLPFVTMRLYTIISYNLVTYSLIFFTAKNILVILLLFYKVFTLCQKQNEKKDENIELSDKERVSNGGQDSAVRQRNGLTDVGSSVTSTGQAEA